jgi:hypothetical protein
MGEGGETYQHHLTGCSTQALGYDSHLTTIGTQILVVLLMPELLPWWSPWTFIKPWFRRLNSLLHTIKSNVL